MSASRWFAVGAREGDKAEAKLRDYPETLNEAKAPDSLGFAVGRAPYRAPRAWLRTPAALMVAGPPCWSVSGVYEATRAT